MVKKLELRYINFDQRSVFILSRELTLPASESRELILHLWAVDSHALHQYVSE